MLGSCVQRLARVLPPMLPMSASLPSVLTAPCFTRITHLQTHSQTNTSRAHCNPVRSFCLSAPRLSNNTVKVTFLLKDGDKHELNAKVGDNLLDLVIDHDVDIDGFGACEGTLACSTCHLIFSPEDFDKIPDKMTDEELDMLDLAYGLTDTSRLGCQVVLTKEMDGIEIKVPTDIADARRGPL